MHDLIRKILGYKTVDQKYHNYFMVKNQLHNINTELDTLSREFTVKNELQKSIMNHHLYEDEVKDRVREKFADFLKSYSDQLVSVLDKKHVLEQSKENLEGDTSLIFADLKKAFLGGALQPEMYLQLQDSIEKAKNPKNKVAKVMREYESGKLKSGSGDKITNRDQAVAIALSEAGIKKGDIDKADPCWSGHEMVGMKKKDGNEVPNCVKKAEDGDTEHKVKEMALTKGEKEEKHYPEETKKEYEDHEGKESAEREKKEHESGGYEEKPAKSKEEFQAKEREFERKNSNLKKGHDIPEQHLKDMVKEHERIIPLLNKYSDDPAVANELATQKKELEQYSSMLSKAEYYTPENGANNNGELQEQDRDFLNKGYQLIGFNVNAKNEVDLLDFEYYPEVDIEKADYQGENVQLGKPMSGDVKKYKVYVKNDKGNVVKVEFGDPNMEIKRDNPERRRSFRARHKCDQQKDRTSAGYWSCKMWSKTPVSQLTKAFDCLEIARDIGEIDEFEYNSWLEKAKAGTYADNEMNRRLGRAGEKYGAGDEDEDEDKKKNESQGVEEDESKKEGGSGTPEINIGIDRKDSPYPATPKVAALKQKNPRIKKLLEQAKKASKKNLEGAINQSEDSELRAVAQQELERRKMEENVSSA